ncbi:TonB-dependent receptor domain-containing protein [Rhodospirillaceae bacterium SYSU D60014]|uniref:TonB-dependent receptor domain-containing protein n=1 Tax=Virgifigura deserti TaxID=2268457 RepID=UPI000E65F4CD
MFLRFVAGTCFGKGFGIFFLSSYFVGFIDARAEDAIELAPVVVSATSTERQLRDAPATVTVITQEELQERPVQDLSDALRGTPGITINSIGLNRRGISIRGMSAEHTLILVDGKRVNAAGNAIAHADFDLNWVPVEAIERIEVVRGPMSSLYGSEALGGVVNVITRKATDVWKGSVSGTGGLQEGSGGDTYQTGAYVGGPLVPGRLGLSLYAEIRGRGETPDPNEPRLSELEERDAKTGSATLTWTPDEAQRIDLGFGYGTEERVRKIQTGGPAPTFYESTDDIERQHLSLSHRGEWEWGSTTLRAYRSMLDRENRRTQGAPSGPNKLTDDTIDGHVSAPVLDWNLITVGGEWRRERLEDPTVNLRGEAEAEHQALFLQDEIAISPDWSLLIGNRADHHEEFGWHHSPRAYLVHHLTDALTLKGGVGMGFKAPTLKQLSPEYEAVAAAGRFTIVGNPDLKPETNTMYELGLDYVGSGWSLRATLFQNDLEDLIQTRCVQSCGIRGAERRTYENVDEARIRGVELGGGVDLPGQLRLDANYTYLDTEDRATGEELAERPRHGLNAALSWFPTDAFMARLRSEYVGRQIVDSGPATETLPDYAIWSIDLSHQLTDAVTLRGGIHNLTDERLAEKSSSFTYAEPGRLFWVGLNYSF